MRLSEGHYEIIKEMKKAGYVWLSDMHVNAQMRFRNRTRKGFDKFVKVEGLTFLTKDVAEALSVGVKRGSKKRLTLTEQVERLTEKVAKLELENKILKEKAPKDILDALPTQLNYVELKDTTGGLRYCKK